MQKTWSRYRTPKRNFRRHSLRVHHLVITLQEETSALRLGQHETAIGDLENAVKMAGDPGLYLEPLGYAQLAGQRQQDAIDTFTKALEDDADSAPALMGRGLAYYQVGQKENARVDFEKAIQLQPNHAYPRKYLGALLHDLGENELAKTHLAKAAKIDPHDIFIRKSLGRLYFDQQALSLALREFEVSLGLDQTDVESLVGRGVVQHAIGEDLPGAARDFLVAISKMPETAENAYLWSNLGQVLGELGDSTEALNYLSRAIELDPEFPEARSHRAHLLATHNPTKSAMETARSDVKAVFGAQGKRTYWDYRALAAVNAALGDYERATRFQSTGEKLLKQTGPKRFLESASQTRMAYEKAVLSR